MDASSQGNQTIIQGFTITYVDAPDSVVNESRVVKSSHSLVCLHTLHFYQKKKSGGGQLVTGK